MENLSILYTHEHAVTQLSKSLSKRITDQSPDSEIIILCIGTDRSTGDSLGPLIGSKLFQQSLRTYRVYGNLDEPVHAMNLEETLSTIHDKHHNPFIIAIDACLGRLKSVGLINLMDGPLKPGTGVKKDLPEVGNIHITGIVNVGGFMEYFVLQNTRLSLVMKMAEVISNAISGTMHQIHLNQNSTSKLIFTRI